MNRLEVVRVLNRAVKEKAMIGIGAKLCAHKGDFTLALQLGEIAKRTRLAMDEYQAYIMNTHHDWASNLPVVTNKPREQIKPVVVGYMVIDKDTGKSLRWENNYIRVLPKRDCIPIIKRVKGIREIKFRPVYQK